MGGDAGFFFRRPFSRVVYFRRYSSCLVWYRLLVPGLFRGGFIPWSHQLCLILSPGGGLWGRGERWGQITWFFRHCCPLGKSVRGLYLLPGHHSPGFPRQSFLLWHVWFHLGVRSSGGRCHRVRAGWSAPIRLDKYQRTVAVVVSFSFWSFFSFFVDNVDMCITTSFGPRSYRVPCSFTTSFDC